MPELNRPAPGADEQLFGFEHLDMVLDGEVIYYTYGNYGWRYGIVKGSRARSVYNELSADGVDSSTPAMRGTFSDTLWFRLARPEEYGDLAFSYEYQPRQAA